MKHELVDSMAQRFLAGDWTLDYFIKLEEIKVPTAEDSETFRNQLRIQVEGERDIDTKKSVLNSLIKN